MRNRSMQNFAMISKIIKKKHPLPPRYDTQEVHNHHTPGGVSSSLRFFKGVGTPWGLSPGGMFFFKTLANMEIFLNTSSYCITDGDFSFIFFGWCRRGGGN